MQAHPVMLSNAQPPFRNTATYGHVYLSVLSQMAFADLVKPQRLTTELLGPLRGIY